MENIKINRKSDFNLLGVFPEDYHNTPFDIIFSSGIFGTKLYKCSYDGEQYINCFLADDKHVNCCFDNHNLDNGTLYYLFRLYDNNGNIKYNYRKKIVVQHNDVNKHICLTSGRNECTVTLEFDL